MGKVYFGILANVSVLCRRHSRAIYHLYLTMRRLLRTLSDGETFIIQLAATEKGGCVYEFVITAKNKSGKKIIGFPASHSNFTTYFLLTNSLTHCREHGKLNRYPLKKCDIE